MLEFTRLPQIACVETDRFCDACGYNLRTQAVRRDPRTEILLCRCPECGRFHPASEAATAGRLWLQRLMTLLLAFWIILIGSAVCGFAVGQGSITAFTLDALTYNERVSMPGGRSGRYTYVLQPRPVVREPGLLCAISGSTSLGLGLFASFAAVVVFPHWRRWIYSAVALAWPVAVALVVVYIWWTVAPHLMRWGWPYIWGHALVCILGGVVGAAIGRPLARLIVRLCLPPRLRPALSYLWVADGLPPPSGAEVPQR